MLTSLKTNSVLIVLLVEELSVLVVFLVDLGFLEVVQVVFETAWSAELLVEVSLGLVRRLLLSLAQAKREWPLLRAWVLLRLHLELQMLCLLQVLLKGVVSCCSIRLLATVEERGNLFVLTVDSLDWRRISWNRLSVVASTALLLICTSNLVDDEAAQAFSFLR